jgi:hypothetical protein
MILTFIESLIHHHLQDIICIHRRILVVIVTGTTIFVGSYDIENGRSRHSTKYDMLLIQIGSRIRLMKNCGNQSTMNVSFSIVVEQVDVLFFT